MTPLIIIAPETSPAPTRQRLEGYLAELVPADTRWVRTAAELDVCRGRHLLFAIALDEAGMNRGLDDMQRRLAQDQQLLAGATAAICVDGPSELYTKSIAREVVFRANQSGCAFIPKPLIEATGNLYNFELRASLLNCDRSMAYRHHLQDLLDRLLKTKTAAKKSQKPKVLAIASTNRLNDANSVCFWRLVEQALGSEISTQLLNLGKGDIHDCFACSWEHCTHQGCPQPDLLCDYGFEYILDADALIVLAPNLNDSIGPDLAAFINRMTYLSQTNRLANHLLYAIIVSGYSGSDLLARQLLNALCLNKGLQLPPYFAAMETANRPRSILELPGVNRRAAAFADRIKQSLLPVHVMEESR